MNHKLFGFLLCFCCWSSVFAQSHSNEIGLETDDDSYLAQGSDRYYTAGTFIYYRHALRVDSSLYLQNKVLGFELGQKLFTPQSGSINYANVPVYDDPKYDNPAYVDRPFAGYLYVGTNLNLLYKDESNLKLSAQVGVVGPAALGRQTQETLHSLVSLYHPSGWEYQIDNDFEVNLSAEYNKLFARNSWGDVTLASYLNVGNGFTGAGIGPMFRLGDFNQLFNSESTQSTAIKSANFTPLHSRELFFYYKPQLNLVLYDATVQGSLFNARSPTSMEITLTPERFVFSNQFGVGYSGKRFVIDFAAVFHTKDVEQMVQSHQWGDLTVLYRFH
jgi:hypothetical protein